MKRLRENILAFKQGIKSKERELRDTANKMIADRKKSNIVSVFISCCLYNVDT